MVFPPAQKQKSYEVVERRNVGKEYILKAGKKKDKKVKLGRRCVVLKEADDPHLPTSVPGVYWMLSSTKQSSLYCYDF